jgi:hypothetical protein
MRPHQRERERDGRDGLTRAVDSLKFRHVVLFALAFSIYNSMRTPEDVAVNELNRGAGLVDGVSGRPGGGGGGGAAIAGAGTGSSRGQGAGRKSRKAGGDGDPFALLQRAPFEKPKNGHAGLVNNHAEEEDEEVTPAREQAEAEAGGTRPQLGCRVALPPKAHWTVRMLDLYDTTPTRDRCRWACVAGKAWHFSTTFIFCKVKAPLDDTQTSQYGPCKQSSDTRE